MPLFFNPPRRQGRMDRPLILIFLTLVIIGWVSIYSAVFDQDHQSIADYSQRYGKQLVWILTSFLLAFIIWILDPKYFVSIAYPFYVLTTLLLVAVLFVGTEVAGSRSWFDLGFIRLQPAEFAKLAAALTIAKLLSTHGNNIKERRTQIKLMLIIMVPVALILMQNDTGSAMVYSAFFVAFYREGFSGNIFILGVYTVILVLATLIFDELFVVIALATMAALGIYLVRKSIRNILVVVSIFIASSAFVYGVHFIFDNVLLPHQSQRINVLLGKSSDPLGAEYNVTQSKIAIGSGGLTGKGFLQGTQTKFNFVPEQSTDFIFCTIGEEWGFVGSTILIAIFILLIFRIINLAERQRSHFSRIYGYCVASIIFFHFVINLGMTIGFIPVIGIPLPFVSYGGSSLWSFTILLFIFIKLDAHHQEVI